MKRTPLRKVSKKRAKQLREYGERRKEFLRTHLCYPCFFEAGKVVQPTDVHHMDGREGQLLLNEDKWMGVCRPCHRKIHDNPAWAKERGYLK
jgi:hypothetical protein